MLDNLRKFDILLASKSPRRRELMEQMNIPFRIVTVGGPEETHPDDIPAIEVPEYLSRKKSEAFRELIHDNEMLITADTLVILKNKIYGKPETKEEAVGMLKELSGQTHQVATGVCITTAERQLSFTSVTNVRFAELEPDEINYYVECYKPFDKAGAYGIQEWIGCVAVEAIEGSYYNVMGLPVHRLFKELKKF